MHQRRWAGWALAAVFAVAASASLLQLPAAVGQPYPEVEGDDPALPGGVVVDIDAIESQAMRLGIPNLLGSGADANVGGEILRQDFTLFPGYRVVGPDSVRHDVSASGLGIRAGAWGALNVDGVIKGELTTQGSRRTAEMRFYRMSNPGSPALSETYSGTADELRGWMHDFGNKVLELLTGRAGPFGTHMAWAQRIGPGRKDVMCGDMDGHGIRRVSNGRGIAMLPSFDDAMNIWFTRLTSTGMFITRTGIRGRPILESDGITMAPSICGGRVFFASSRDGNSEIYSARVDGSDIQRLTRHPGIDVSPTCGPNNKLAWVSAQHGTPQIWLMNQDGTRQERLTFQGNHNQTPAFCRDPRVPLVAFTGRDGPLDIFTVNVNTKEILRVTQGQGNNKDPAFSPDCRMLAFVSDRRGAPGIYVSSPLGFNQHRVVAGEAETVRWMHAP